MKWLLLSLLFLTCAAVDCRKNRDIYMKQGTLTGPDFALCSCCGGVVLQIPGINKSYRIDSLPGMSNQQFYTQAFPKNIIFNYADSSECGGITRFRVTEYEIVN